MMKTETLWQELESQDLTGTGKGILKRLVVTSQKCDLFLGVVMPGKHRSIVLELPRDIVPFPETVPVSRGLDCDVIITGQELNTGYASLVLKCSSKEYHEIFASIADDIIEVVIPQPDQKKLVRAFINRLFLWQSCFERQGDEGLGEAAQRGLYAELYFLSNYLLDSDTGPNEAVSMWTGPESRQHDFQGRDFQVECKSSIAKQHQKITVSSEQQLDDQGNGGLYLFFLSLSSFESGPETLPSLVATVRSKVASHAQALSLFNAKLIASGYLDTQEQHYIQNGYRVRSEHVFAVEEGFPRLLEKDLPSGVGDLQYSIALTACQPFEINRSSFPSLSSRNRHE